MAEIRRFPLWRHLRGDPNFHILRYRRGQLRQSGPGISFWFHPMNTSVVEIPIDDRELPFLYHARSQDFQDVTVQGVITFRVFDPERLAGRVDFTVDLRAGLLTEQPMEKLSGLVTELAQQFTWDYLTHTPLVAILEQGFEEIRTRIETGFSGDQNLTAMGLEIVTVRIGGVRPEAEVENALQTPVRERIQQQADEATFERRAMAVEKERAIQENELQNQIELARRESSLIEQRGANERQRVQKAAEAAHIEAKAQARRNGIEAQAQAQSIRAVEQERVKAEESRMNIYRDFPSQMMLGLAAQKLAGKLNRIEHLSVTPDMLGSMLTQLAQAGTARLEREADG
jgi:regulator of protease activity HflC (stomatin/prohibitin superfamily)